MTRFKARLWYLLPLVAGLITTGCGGTTKAGVSSTAGGTGFPVKVGAANGAVTIPHEPTRIVSLSATATEDLYAVGAGGQVVAVDSYSTYPPQAPRTHLSGFTPDVEAIANYRPDLVIVAEDADHIVAQLQKLQIPVLVEPPAISLEAAYREIAQLGQATGHAVGALKVVGQMRRQVAAVVRSVPRPSRPLRVYHELEPSLYSASSRTFVGQIYAMLGLKNIADKAHASGEYPQLSAEYVIAADPDLIVLSDTVCCKQSPATVAARPGWRNIAAVKSGGVVPVDDSIASHWGPRLVVFMKKVAKAVKGLEARSR